MIDRQRLLKVRSDISKKISFSNPDLLRIFPIERYIIMLGKYPELESYMYVSDEVRNYCADLIRASDEKILGLYLQLLLVSLIERTAAKLEEDRNLPVDILDIYGMNFNRIIKNIERDTLGVEFYSNTNDKFSKDLAVCSMRMIPAGARKIHLSKLPRRFLFGKGINQFIRGVFYISFKMRGFMPVYTQHMDSHDPDLLKEFSPEGLHRFYIRVAELMKRDKRILGIYGVSWFYDPKLKDISPNLNYIREIVNKNGGAIFYAGVSENTVKNATRLSPIRRNLYEIGKYKPANYMAVWNRSSLIKWAESNSLNI